MNYLEKLNKEDGSLSRMELPKFEGDLVKFFIDKKIESLYSERVYIKKNNVDVKKIFYKTPQNFYILAEQTDKVLWDCSIYFKESSYNELIFFLNNFLKNYKHATTNN